MGNQVQFLAGLIPVQLEDRIVNPDLRDHSLLGPILNPEITTGRAPYWASGAKSSNKLLFFKIQDMDPQNHILSFCCTILIEWLHFRPLVLISALADCKCYFYSRGPNCKQNLAVPDSSETARFFFFFKDFYTSYEASIAALVLCFERSTGKEHFKSTPASSDQGRGHLL